MEVIDALKQARRQYGLPTTIWIDQGQFTSKKRDLWAYANGITLDFSRPGKATDNAYGEKLQCHGASAGIGSWIWTTPAKRLTMACRLDLIAQ